MTSSELHNASAKFLRVTAAVLFQSQIIALSSLARLRLLNVLTVSLRRLNPHRLDIILDLELELNPHEIIKSSVDVTFMASQKIIRPHLVTHLRRFGHPIGEIQLTFRMVEAVGKKQKLNCGM